MSHSVTPVAAKARMASASARLASVGQAAAQLRAVSLEPGREMDLTARTRALSALFTPFLGEGSMAGLMILTISETGEVSLEATTWGVTLIVEKKGRQHEPDLGPPARCQLLPFLFWLGGFPC